MEGAASAGAGQRDRPRKGGKRTKASKAQELFEEEPTKFDKFARWIMGNRDSSVLAFFAGVRRRSVLRVFKSGVEVTRLQLR